MQWSFLSGAVMLHAQSGHRRRPGLPHFSWSAAFPAATPVFFARRKKLLWAFCFSSMVTLASWRYW